MTNETSTATEFAGTFIGAENWHNEYQRNNKGGGLKNLRCFPYCREKHVVKGFCGRGVKFELKRKTKGKPLYAWAEFVPKHIEGTVQIGTKLSSTKCKEQERSSKCLQNPYYKGHVVSENSRCVETVLFEFNKQKMGWNYSWHSNKHTSNIEHCLVVYVFKPNSDSDLVCCAKFKSPYFKLYSRRKGEQIKNMTMAASCCTMPHNHHQFHLQHQLPNQLFSQNQPNTLHRKRALAFNANTIIDHQLKKPKFIMAPTQPLTTANMDKLQLIAEQQLLHTMPGYISLNNSTTSPNQVPIQMPLYPGQIQLPALYTHNQLPYNLTYL